MDATRREAPAGAGDGRHRDGRHRDGRHRDGGTSEGDSPAGRIAVRRAGPGDWAALRQARLAALADSPEAFGSTLAHEQALSEEEWRQRTQTASWFLAWRGNTPAGLVAAFPVAGTPAAEWHLISMWASPQARGQRVADQLVDTLAGAVKEAGAARLTLWAADGNERARGFYRRYGFRPTGRRQAYRRPDGSTFDEDEFELSL